MAQLSETDEALMLAYVYGELSASDARAFERRLDAEPELRAEVEGLKATHDLFGRDADWGLRSGTDVPPPHLVDAIMKAEALARTPQVREAAVKRGASSSPLTARLARWLLGGGALVGAAAVIFLVVQRAPSAPEDTFAAATSAAKAAPAPPPPPPAATPPKVAGALEPAPADAAKLEAKPQGRALDALAAGSAAAEDAKGAAVARHAARTRASSGVLAEEQKRDAAGAPASDDLEGFASADRAPAKAKAKERTFDGDDEAQAPPAEKLAEKPAKTPAEKKTAKKDFAPPPPAPSSPPMAAPMAAQEAADAPAPAANVVSPEELARRRMDLLQKREATASPKRSEIEKNEQLQAATFALASGERELKAKHYLAALDAFAGAEHVDLAGALGAAPQLGQMRALLALRRPADAAQIARRVVNRGVKQPDVVDAWLVGTQAAQQIGDQVLERALWTRLLEVPKHSAEARAALARLRSPPVRSYRSDEKAAAEPAAAAAAPPATDKR